MIHDLHWRIDVHDSVVSTQDIARAAALAGAPEGTLVQARMQTGGRGRQGREWQSLDGNLFLSFIVRPLSDAATVGQLALVTAVALGQTIKPYAQGMMLKWPNDVLLCGKKCAGILIDSSVQPPGDVEWAVIGVGVNIAAAPEGPFACLQDELAGIVRLTEFRDKFLNNFNALYNQWSSGGFAAIRALWLAMAHPPGQRLTVRLEKGEFEGAFETLDPLGRLVIRLDTGEMKTIGAGDVFLAAQGQDNAFGD